MSLFSWTSAADKINTAFNDAGKSLTQGVKDTITEQIEVWAKEMAKSLLTIDGVIGDITAGLAKLTPGVLTFTSATMASALEKFKVLKRLGPIADAISMMLKGTARGFDLGLQELDAGKKNANAQSLKTKMVDWLLARGVEPETIQQSKPSFLAIIPAEKQNHFCGLWWSLMDACLKDDVDKFHGTLDGMAYKTMACFNEVAKEQPAELIKLLEVHHGRNLNHEELIELAQHEKLEKLLKAEERKLGRPLRSGEKDQVKRHSALTAAEEQAAKKRKVYLSGVERVRRNPAKYGGKIFPLVRAVGRFYPWAFILDQIDVAINLAIIKRWLVASFSPDEGISLAQIKKLTQGGIDSIPNLGIWANASIIFTIFLFAGVASTFAFSFYVVGVTDNAAGLLIIPAAFILFQLVLVGQRLIRNWLFHRKYEEIGKMRKLTKAQENGGVS